MEFILGLVGGAAAVCLFAAGAIFERQLWKREKRERKGCAAGADTGEQREAAEREAFRALMAYSPAIAYGEKRFGEAEE